LTPGVGSGRFLKRSSQPERVASSQVIGSQPLAIVHNLSKPPIKTAALKGPPAANVFKTVQRQRIIRSSEGTIHFGTV